VLAALQGIPLYRPEAGSTVTIRSDGGRVWVEMDRPLTSPADGGPT
jgi:hypothetical protein